MTLRHFINSRDYEYIRKPSGSVYVKLPGKDGWNMAPGAMDDAAIERELERREGELTEVRT